MKKYIGILFFMVVLISCSDYRYDNMVNDTAYFVKSGLQEHTINVTSDNDYIHSVWIHKGGYFQEKYAGKLEIDYNYLVEYNNSNGTDFEMLGENFFSLEHDFLIEQGGNEVSIPLTLHTKKIIEELGYGTVYIPLKVKSLTQKGGTYEDKSHFILALTLKELQISIDGEWKGYCRNDFSSSDEVYEFDITAAMDDKTIDDIQINYNKDITLLKPGELELGSQYYSYESSVSIVKGEKYGENYLSVNVKDMPVGEWVIPIRLSATNPKIKVNQDAWLALTVKKGELDAVVWGGNFFQGNKVVLPAKQQTSIVIGSFSGVTLDIEADNTWVHPRIEGSNIVIDVDANTQSVTKLSTVRVKNKANNLTKNITIVQANQELGLPLNKSIWTVEAYSNNCANKANKLYMMYDDKWRKNAADTDSYVELDDRKGTPTSPFVITFNLGQEQNFNSFGLMPRQQWYRPAPKRIKIEVSEDNINWTAVGQGRDANGILPGLTDAETNAQLPTYNGKIHWATFDAPVKARYVRLSLYESWWNDGAICCIEEVFASLK